MQPTPARLVSLSVSSTADLRARAQEYRVMAASARTRVAHDGLLRLASRFDALADAKEERAATDLSTSLQAISGIVTVIED